MNTEVLKKTSTETSFDADIVGGTFTPSEARDTLLKAIHNQLNFYKIKNLSLDCRYGCQSDEIWNKVEDLEATLESAQAMVEKARRFGLNLRVKSRITIELDDSERLD